MLVIDASALTELIVGGPRASAIGPVMEDDGDWAAPEHFMVEVVSALRGMWLGGHLTKEEFTAAAHQSTRADVSTYRTQGLIGRILELAPRTTAYDAAYVALAETLDCPLVTLDGPLRSLTGVNCQFLPECL